MAKSHYSSLRMFTDAAHVYDVAVSVCRLMCTRHTSSCSLVRMKYDFQGEEGKSISEERLS